ncbi:MAG: hypothetical protein JNK48_00360 [Bryobacterales bacterium]|nr:hypothetical protein [Bryobacterales bacterium]
MASPARIVITAACLLSGFAVGTWIYRGYFVGIAPAEQLARLPVTNLRLAIDVKTLRAAGIVDRLAGKSAEEPDYLSFVKETGFDYKKDLDFVLASYSAGETLAFLTGRFDWHNMQQYASKHGGACKDGICRMPASTPGRHLSYQRIAAGLLAFASSTDSEAVTKLNRPNGANPKLPTQPIWLLIPPDSFRDASALPAATHLFATALSTSSQVLLSFGAAGSAFEARLEAECRTAEHAEQIVRELKAATTVLQRTMPRQPQAPTLSGILSAGTFSVNSAKISGVWPIPRAAIDAFSGTAP